MDCGCQRYHKSALHAHARMIAIIVEKSLTWLDLSLDFFQQLYIYIYIHISYDSYKWRV